MPADEAQQSYDRVDIRETDADRTSQECSVIEARISDDDARLAELAAKHRAACSMTGDRGPRDRKVIERQIRETQKHKTELEQRLRRVVETTPPPRDWSDLLTLPEGLRHSGDPVEGNPFPDGDPRHKVWDDATREAEEQWCRLNSEPEITQADRSDVLIDSVCQRFAGRFDVWARRGVHVVWSDAAVSTYDQWLINYAEAWLQDVYANKLYSRVVPLHHLLNALRLVLTKRANWWKAEARRYLAERKDHAESPNASSLLPPPSRKPTRRKTKLQEKREGVIFAAIQAELKGPKYCGSLDRGGLGPPVSWVSEGCPRTYSAAYKAGCPWQKRIQDEKHRFKIKYERTAPAERERLIQTSPRSPRS